MATANGAVERGREVVDRAEEAVVRGARRAKAAGRQMLDRVEDTGEEIRHRGETLMHDVEAMVARKPFASVLAAAAAGYLVAKLWR